MQEKNGKNTRKIRLILSFFGLSFLMIHFGITFLFTSPLKMHENENIHYVVNGYIYPLFWQNWSLFVPSPKDNKKIEIQFKESEESYSDFIDPLENHYKTFSWLRYGPQGKVILGFDNALWWVYNDLRKLKTPWGRKLEGLEAERFKSMNGYYTLRNLVIGTFKQKYKGAFLGAIVRFSVEDTEFKQEYFIEIEIE